MDMVDIGPMYQEQEEMGKYDTILNLYTVGGGGECTIGCNIGCVLLLVGVLFLVGVLLLVNVLLLVGILL